MVVDVLALLDLSRNRAPASAAGDKPYERMLPLGVSWMVRGFECILNGFEQAVVSAKLVSSIGGLSALIATTLCALDAIGRNAIDVTPR